MMLYFVMLALVVILSTIVILQTRTMRRMREEALQKPIGRVVSAKITADGLMVTGEIYNAETWDKISHNSISGMSIGYSDTLEVFPLKSVSIDAQPNAWGETIHLIEEDNCECPWRPGHRYDCPLYKSEG